MIASTSMLTVKIVIVLHRRWRHNDRRIVRLWAKTCWWLAHLCGKAGGRLVEWWRVKGHRFLLGHWSLFVCRQAPAPGPGDRPPDTLRRMNEDRRILKEITLFELSHASSRIVPFCLLSRRRVG